MELKIGRDTRLFTYATVVPLNRQLEKFGEYRAKDHTRFDVSSVRLNDVDVDGDGIADEVAYAVVQDDFVPAHFGELSNAQRLSADSYEKMAAGVSIAPDVVRSGEAGSRVLDYTHGGSLGPPCSPPQ